MSKQIKVLARTLLCLAAVFSGINSELFSAEAKKAPEFPIIAWNMIDDKVPVLGYYKDPQKFKVMKECGFSEVCMVPSEMLAECQEAGLKAWVYDPELYNLITRADQSDEQAMKAKIDALVKRNNQNPALAGYVLQDEPPAKLYPHIKKLADYTAQVSGGKGFYVNLLPNYANAAQLGVPTYQQYVEDFIKICKPPFVAYDHYGMEDTGKLRDGYWKNMECVYGAAKKANIPVYPIILSVTGLSYRELTESDILFQVFTHLAQGAKGIEYFTYFTPAYSNYRNAPIDQFGNKTPMWSIVQRVNNRLKAIGPVLATLNWQRSYHSGKSIPAEVPKSVVTPDSLVQKVMDAQAIDKQAEAFVGEFLGADNSHYVMVVNKDQKKSMVMDIRWKGTPKAVHEVMRSHGTLIPWALGENAWVGPSEGVLLKVDY